MTHVVRWIVLTKRGHKDHQWGPEIIARSYFDTEDGALREKAASERMGRLLGRIYTVQREEFDCEDELPVRQALRDNSTR